LAAVRAELGRIHPKLVDGNVRALRDILKLDLAVQHTAMRILAILGCVALLLASVGTYGVMAYVVNSRTREIGIRLAVGATRTHAMVLILSMGLHLGLLAIVIGVPIAMGLATILRSQIEGISPFDPISFVVVILSVLTALIVACWIPARRAARIDPMEALRYE
jgi:ABC-type antimicrobial peptide transport system permease subunit